MVIHHGFQDVKTEPDQVQNAPIGTLWLVSDPSQETCIQEPHMTKSKVTPQVSDNFSTRKPSQSSKVNDSPQLLQEMTKLFETNIRLGKMPTVFEIQCARAKSRECGGEVQHLSGYCITKNVQTLIQQLRRAHQT